MKTSASANGNGHVNGKLPADVLDILDEYRFICPDKEITEAVARATEIGLSADLWPSGRGRMSRLPDIKGWKVIVVAGTDEKSQRWCRKTRNECIKKGATVAREFPLFGLGAEFPTLAEWMDRHDLVKAITLQRPWIETTIEPAEDEPEPPPVAVKSPAEDYICAAGGQPISCPSNTKRWLGLYKPENHVRYDRFRQSILLGGAPLTDQLVTDLAMEIEADLRVPWSQEHVRSALVHLAHKREFSSLTEWLDSLKWDGISRIEKFFPDHFESQDDEYSHECGRVFFLSAVARAYKPGCQADVMPVLISPQGRRKSTGIAALCPNSDWFAEDIGAELFAGKAAEGLQGKWLIEFSEFARINRSTSDVAKSFISRRVDRYRPPYGRIAQDFPRTCTFFGTTNDEQPLQDIENRRYMTLDVIQGDADKIASSRDQLWAEAVHRFKAGEPWHTTSSHLIEKCSSHVEKARIEDIYEPILREKLERYSETTVVDAAKLLGLWDDSPEHPVNKLNKSEQTRIGIALRKIGFRRDRRKTGLREWYYLREIGPTIAEPF